MSELIRLKNGDEYIFDIHAANPFLIFPWLQKIAAEHHAPKDICDLSRGDPGYGFSPSSRSRRFVSYLLFLDSLLNTFEKKFVDWGPENISKLLEFLRTATQEHFAISVANELLLDLNQYLTELKRIAAADNLPADDHTALMHTFGFSNVAGGNYHQPWGDPLTRAVLADWHSTIMGTKISYNDLLLTSGSSHGIGTIYEAFGAEGIGYLKEGDSVVLFSPSYFPYVNLQLSRQLKTVMIRMDPLTGEIDRNDLEKAKEQPVKMIVVIDPNNPTGFALSEEIQDLIAELAEKTNAIIVTDEVYHSFFPGKKSLLQHPIAGKRTIKLDSLSKIERSTGIRLGDILIRPEGERFLTAHLKPFLRPNDTIRTLLYRAKSPGGGQIGPFHHTTVIPGPSQFLGISHIIFGKTDRDLFLHTLKNNMTLFHETLGIPYQGSFYYSMFDVKSIPGWKDRSSTPEQIFIDLARLGVVLLPANGFFLPEDRKKVDRTTVVRVSLGNVNSEKCKKAAEIILHHACLWK